MAPARGGAGLAGWRHPSLRQELLAWNADYRTATGEIREIVLADGTRAWLGAASALDVNYGLELRLLRLLAGEVHIETAPDAQRAFVVDTPHGRLRALGTRFNVKLTQHGSLLAVYQGAVEIRTLTTSRTATALDMLAQSLPIRVNRRLPWWVTVERAP